MQYELSDHGRAASKPMLPNKPRGVPRVNDRRVLNGDFWVCDPRRTVARSATGALAAAHDADIQMIDTSIVRVHEHAACIAHNEKGSWAGRGRVEAVPGTVVFKGTFPP